MAKLDLSRFGVKVTHRGYVEGGPVVEVGIDVSELEQRIKAFDKAAQALSDAWLALPVGAREHYDGATITFIAHPEDD